MAKQKTPMRGGDKRTEMLIAGLKEVLASVERMDLPDVEAKIMDRSYQRAGVVGGGTLLSSGARQATVSFTPEVFDKLKDAADKNHVSLSEMVRQCVSTVLDK